MLAGPWIKWTRVGEGKRVFMAHQHEYCEA